MNDRGINVLECELWFIILLLNVAFVYIGDIHDEKYDGFICNKYVFVKTYCWPKYCSILNYNLHVHGPETWSLILKEKKRRRELDNKAPTRIFRVR
jgi:hypothetical protein